MGAMMAAKWGQWGDESACEHLLALREYLLANELSVSGEGTQNPRGWVNVHCARCNRTYEVTLQKPFKANPE